MVARALLVRSPISVVAGAPVWGYSIEYARNLLFTDAEADCPNKSRKPRKWKKSASPHMEKKIAGRTFRWWLVSAPPLAL